MSRAGNATPVAPASPKPTPLAPVWDAIPHALRTKPSWVLWRYKAEGARWTKPPMRVRGMGLASTKNPATWAPFEEARQAAERAKGADATNGADGVGLVLVDDLVGIDLDHVLNPSGPPQPWASEVLQRFQGCYVERSPSGDGLRIFCRGAAPRCGKGGPENRLEVYDKTSPRYLTVTGHALQPAGEVTHAQAALD